MATALCSFGNRGGNPLEIHGATGLEAAAVQRSAGHARRSGNSSSGLYFGAVGKARKTPTLTEHLIMVGPRPAAELVALIVGKGLHQFFACIHYERAVLRHRLIYRFALQQQQP